MKQNRNQMLHRDLPGLVDVETLERATRKMNQRPLLPNEILKDIKGKTVSEVLDEAIFIIDNFNSAKDYSYQPMEIKMFDSWVQSIRRQMEE